MNDLIVYKGYLQTQFTKEQTPRCHELTTNRSRAASTHSLSAQLLVCLAYKLNLFTGSPLRQHRSATTAAILLITRFTYVCVYLIVSFV